MRLPGWVTLILIGYTIVFAGCRQEVASVTPIAGERTPTLQPTPTLLPGLPTLPPPAAVAPARLPTPPVEPTAEPTATANLAPAEHLLHARRQIHNGNLAAALGHLEAARQHRSRLSPAQESDVFYQLGTVHLRSGRYEAALEAFEEALRVEDVVAPAPTMFLMGQSYAGLSDYERAIEAYRTYLGANEEMLAYVNPFIATAQLNVGDRAAAVLSYEEALTGAAHRLTLIEIHRQLAGLYLGDADYRSAVRHYDAIHDLARTELTKGEMTYLAGQAELAAGDVAAAHARFQEGVARYPRAYQSYSGLILLVEAGVDVDSYQRGLVDYYAAAYDPAITAFRAHINQNPDNYRTDAYLFIARAYSGLGDEMAAQAALTQYALNEPAAALLEQAQLKADFGNVAAAISDYALLEETYPEDPLAADAAWRAGRLAESIGEEGQAVTHYLLLAARFDQDDRAPAALFRAGLLLDDQNPTAAIAVWHRLARTYPADEFGAAAVIWLERTLRLPVLDTPEPFPAPTIGEPTGTATPLATELIGNLAAELVIESVPVDLAELAGALDGESYYALRARDVMAGVKPFKASSGFHLPEEESELEAQRHAEEWLRRRLALDEAVLSTSLMPQLVADERRIVGEKLWQLGLWSEAKRELEDLRTANQEDAWPSYQLALYFRDLGLYRSSILAAVSAISLTTDSIREGPLFLGRLAYPTYYVDLVIPQAERYGFDPRLQLALLRQESLFESFARSGAAAQGLSQVIPDTGTYVARQLSWPDYRNEDLYRPYVGIAFGAYYLAEQLERFNGDVHAALAAYNAGPGNAVSWHDETGDDHDAFLESINFPETRLYVERIYAGFAIYSYLYGDS